MKRDDASHRISAFAFRTPIEPMLIKPGVNTINIDLNRRGASALGIFALLALASVFVLSSCADPCGSGTELSEGSCVPSASGCGAGTTLEDGVCVPSDDRCADGLLLYARVCVAGPGACGSGSAADEESGRCITDEDVLCGVGTRLSVEDVCVADACGPKTEADEDGRCVLAPTACDDGAVLEPQSGRCVQSDEVCSDGAAYDVEANTCRPGPGICDDGTRFIDELGVCVPENCRPGDVIVEDVCARPADELVDDADVTSVENDDPNLGGTANPITLPDAGEAPAIFYGTIDEGTDLDDDGRDDQDVDAFAFEAGAGTWVEVTTQAIGVPSASFVIRGPNGYRRETSSGMAMTKARRLVLPYEGEYRVEVMPTAWSDAVDRNDVPDPTVGPFGAPDWDYVGTLRHMDAPAARSITLDDNQAAIEGMAGTLDDAYLELSGYDAPFLTFDSMRNLAGLPLEILVWGGGDAEPTAYRFDYRSKDLNLRADGGIERIYIDWLDGAAADRQFEATLRGVIDMGRFDTTEEHVSDELSSVTRVFEFDVPPYTVVDMSATEVYRFDAQFVRDGDALDVSAHFDQNGTFTGFSGSGDETWYLLSRPGQFTHSGPWTLVAKKATPVDHGTFSPGDVINESGTLSCSDERKHLKFETDRAANFFAKTTRQETRRTPLSARSAGMQTVLPSDFDIRTTGYEVSAHVPWVVSFDCTGFAGQPYTTTVTIDESRRTDLGLLSATTPVWHDLPGMGEGQTVDVDFEVPANRIIEVGYDHTGFRDFHVQLRDAEGDLIEAQERADDAMETANPRPAISHLTLDGGRFTLRITATEAYDARAFVRAREFDRVTNLGGAQTVSLQANPTWRDAKRVWSLDVTEDVVFRQLAAPDNQLGQMEVIDAATGEVAASVSPTYADTVTLPLDAGRWLVVMEGFGFGEVQIDFETFSAAVSRQPLASPAVAFEPVHRRIPIANCPTIDDVALTMQAPGGSTFPFVTLVAPDGRSVDVHRGEERQRRAYELGYRVPNIAPTESLAEFEGGVGTGDWFLQLYDDDTNGAVLDTMALEVTCSQ